MTFDIPAIWVMLTQFITQYGIQLVGALIMGVLGWFAALWVGRGVRRLAERSESLGPTLAPVLSKAARFTVLAIVLTAVLDKLSIDTSSLLAALGAFGLAVGLALRDTISDIAAGIVLLVLRPFDTGDEVDIDGTQGTVASIDLFQTHLTSFDGVAMVLPNHKVRTARISNYTHADKRRVELTVGIAYEASLEEAIRHVEEVLAKDERVRDEPAPLVSPSVLGEHTVKLTVRAWIPPDHWTTTKMDLLRKIKLTLDRAKIPLQGTEGLKA
jgi:small conductance mechanosensitive channel